MALVVKVEHNGDIRRFTSMGPASYERILEHVRGAWPQELAAGAGLKYRDDEGDLCTLTPNTMADLLELQPAGAAHSRVLRLVLVAPATPVAPASPGPALQSSAPSFVETNDAALAAGPAAPDPEPAAPPAPSAPPPSPRPAPQQPPPAPQQPPPAPQQPSPAPQQPPPAPQPPRGPAPAGAVAGAMGGLAATIAGTVASATGAVASAVGFPAQLPAYIQQPLVVVHDGSAMDVTLHWSVWAAWPEGAGSVGVSWQAQVVPWVPGAELEIRLPADTDVRNLWCAELVRRTADGIFTIRLAPYPTTSFGGNLGYRNTDAGSVTQRLLGALA